MRYRTLMSGKIHRARVTAADLDYVGSITVDPLLLAAADILPGEKVDVVDVTNGARLSTYTIEGREGAGQIEINGAAAHLIHPGDTVIIIAYGQFAEEVAREHVPHVVHVDAQNRIISAVQEPVTPGTYPAA